MPHQQQSKMAAATDKTSQSPAKISTATKAANRPRTMASTFKSFLSSAKQTISGASTPIPGTPAENTPITEIFPKVDPAVDGDDCDHDCDSCHVSLPRNFKIDEDDQLYGHVKGWSTHILVATGKTDWVRDVADEKGSVMEAIEKKADVKPSNGVSVLQASITTFTNQSLRNSCCLPPTYPLHPIPQIMPSRQLSSSCQLSSLSRMSLLRR